MLKLLLNHISYSFYVAHGFEMQYLAPIGRYVNWKLGNGWDDYNELYHATAYFSGITAEKDVWVHSHLLTKKNEINGVALIVGGNLRKAESKFIVENEAKSLVLKYFHIIDRGKGLGKKWLGEILLPQYRDKGFETVYVSSSHPQSFSLYEKFGRCFHEYSLKSDNRLYNRQGKSFAIKL